MGKKQATILFADIAGCAEVSNNRELKDYCGIIKEFHQIAVETKKSFLSSYSEREQMEFSVRGDEVCLIIHKKNELKDYINDIKKTILYAVLLKLNWLLSEYNQERIRSALMPRDLGIGIHHGPVWFDKYPNSVFGEKGKKSSEGYAINYAKRIEGCSREGRYSKIFVSAEVIHLADKNNMQFDDGKEFNLKGLSFQPHIYELKAIDIDFLLKEIIISPPHGFPDSTRRSYIKAAHVHTKEFWLNELLHLFFKATNDEKSLTILTDEWFRMGHALYSFGRFKEAVEYFKKASDIKPIWEIFLNMGLSYENLGKLEDAIDSYRRALESEDNYNIRISLGSIYLRDGKYEESLMCFEKAVEFCETKDGFSGIAKCYEYMGNEDKKNEFLRKAENIKE